ncbi:hypothetical protein BH11MYX3_BH11MYX3_40970 [soil metagenome]
MDGHRTAERRSLAYHRAIALRLTEDAGLIERARARVRSWRQPEIHVRWIEAWSALLDRPIADVCRMLVDDSEQMTALRQMTPFAGILDARARWSVWRTVR